MNEPTDNRRPRFRPRSPGGLLVLGAGVLVLLGLVAAASRAHHTPGGHSGGHVPPAGVGDYVFTIFVVVIAALALFQLWFWFSETTLPPDRRSQRGSMRVLMFLAVSALIAALVNHVHALEGVRSRTANALQKLQQSQPADRSRDANRLKGEQQGPEFKWLPVLIATAAGLSVLFVIHVRSVRRARRGVVESFLLEEAFEDVVRDTLEDLYAESDPRRAIIAAYARVERLFATYGFPRVPSEAPLEYLERVLPELRASGSALHRLTALFQWAKFSTHDVDRPMRDEAIGALIEVRDELRANRIETELRRAEATGRPVQPRP